MSRPSDLKEQIAARAGELASMLLSDTEVRRHGQYLQRLCPFHEESGPSFRFNPQKGTYICFGCGSIGDVFKLVGQFYKLDSGNREEFKSILNIAAQHLGIIQRDPKLKLNPVRLVPDILETAENVKPVELGPEPTIEEFCDRYGLAKQDFYDASFGFVQRSFRAAHGGPHLAVAYPVRCPSGKPLIKYKTLARGPRGSAKAKRITGASRLHTGDTGIIGRLADREGQLLVLAGGEEKMIVAIKASFWSACLQSGERKPTPGQLKMIVDSKPSAVVVAFDADGPGDKGADETCAALLGAGIQCVKRVRWSENAPSGWDLNDVWKEAREDGVRNVINAASDYVIESQSATETDEPTEPEPPPIPTLGPFPTQSLPKPVADMVRELAWSLEVSESIVAGFVLGALSVSVGGKFIASPWASWSPEPINLYVVVIADSSERKSPAMKLLFDPIVAHQRGISAEYLTAERELKEKKDALERRKRKLSRGAASNDPHAREELAIVVAELYGLPELHPPTLMTAQPSSEALAVLMKRNNERCAIVSDEGGVFDIIAGLYASGQVNMDLYLKAHSGSFYRDDRITRNSITMYHPCLSICVASQPDVLRSIAQKKSIIGRGLMNRFLYVIQLDTPERASTRARFIGASTLQAYNGLIGDLLRLPVPTPDQQPKDRLIRFEPAAAAALEAFSTQMEARCRGANPDLPGLRGWAGKAAGAAMRIASLIHCCRYAGGSQAPSRFDLNAEDARSGIEIIGALTEHARHAFRIMEVDAGKADSATNTEKIIQWMKRRKKTTFVRTEMYQTLRQSMKLSDFDEAMKRLDETGRIRIRMVPPEGKGRPFQEITFVDGLQSQ